METKAAAAREFRQRQFLSQKIYVVFSIGIWYTGKKQFERKMVIGMSESRKNPFPMYRGKPLVRCGDTLYYGNMTDKYVIKIDIKTKKPLDDMEIADKCTVQLMYTDPEIRTRKQIVKTSEKNGLYLALDIADAWLTRALAE